MADILYRQWRMLHLIPRAPRKVDTASIEKQLTDEGMTVHRRTIQRDLVELSRIFPLVCDDRSAPYGWSWAKEAADITLPCIDPHVALTFRLVDDYMSPLLPRETLHYLAPHVKRAKNILNSLSETGLKSWPQRVRIIPTGQPLLAPRISHDVLEAVYDALLREQKIVVTYQARSQQSPKQYELSLHALVIRGGIIYLVGAARDYSNVIQLALHRVQSAEPTDQPANPLPEFDLDQYIENGNFGFSYNAAPINLVARFTKESAFALAETPLSEDQTLTDDGPSHTILTATVPDTLFLRGWLQSYGESVEILAPQAMREEFKTTARRMAEMYGVER